MKHVTMLAAILVLAACSPPAHLSSKGQLKMAVTWPQSFRVQVIPAQTQSIQIRIRGTGIAGTRSETISRGGQNSQTLDLELPVGPKQIEVLALDGEGQALAQDQDELMIRANQSTSVTLQLKPVPRPTPTPSASQGGQSNSGPGPVNSGDTSSSPPSNTADSTPPVTESSDPAPDPSVSASSSSGGSGGGGSGSSGTSNPAPTPTPSPSLAAMPQTVSGLGFPTEIRLLNADSLSATSYVWTCFDTTAPPPSPAPTPTPVPDPGVTATGCGSFSTSVTNPKRVVWNAPNTAGGPYELRLALVTGGVSTDWTVLVTVVSGTGTLGGSSNVGFDGGAN